MIDILLSPLSPFLTTVAKYLFQAGLLGLVFAFIWFVREMKNDLKKG